MIITFLGTGGGRFTTIRQLRRTGGFVVEIGGKRIHVDPGPGALVHYVRTFRRNAPDAVFVSHAHTDHCNDAAPIIELMTNGGRIKRGLLAGGRNALVGSDEFAPAVGPYHKDIVERVEVLDPKGEMRWDNLRILATPTNHSEPAAVGFIIEGDCEKLAYLSDTGYNDELREILEREAPDVIIANTISDGWDDLPLTNRYALRKLLQGIEPQILILQHFGARLLTRGSPEALARWAEQELGIKTIAARDFQRIDTRKLQENAKKEGKTILDFSG